MAPPARLYEQPQLPHGRRLHRHHEPVPGPACSAPPIGHPGRGRGARAVELPAAGPGRAARSARGPPREGQAQPRAAPTTLRSRSAAGSPRSPTSATTATSASRRGRRCGSPATGPIAAGATAAPSPRATSAGYPGIRPTASCSPSRRRPPARAFPGRGPVRDRASGARWDPAAGPAETVPLGLRLQGLGPPARLGQSRPMGCRRRAARLGLRGLGCRVDHPLGLACRRISRRTSRPLASAPGGRPLRSPLRKPRVRPRAPPRAARGSRAARSLS